MAIPTQCKRRGDGRARGKPKGTANLALAATEMTSLSNLRGNDARAELWRESRHWKLVQVSPAPAPRFRWK